MPIVCEDDCMTNNTNTVLGAALSLALAAARGAARALGYVAGLASRAF